MVTLIGDPGAEPPDPGKGNEGWRMPKDKPGWWKGKKTLQEKGVKEPVRPGSSGRTSSRPLRPRQSARSSTEQFSDGEGEHVATEQDDDDWSSLQSSHKSNSGVSSLHSEERELLADRTTRGEPSPVISTLSRANSTEIRPTGQRSASLLSETREESPITPICVGARHGPENSSTTQQESYFESPSPTAIRRRRHTNLQESPFRTRLYPLGGRRLSEPDTLEQAQASIPFGSAPGLVRNLSQHRDSVRAERERYVPENLDIQAASGDMLEYVESHRSQPWLEQDLQVYYDDAAEFEPSQRAGRRLERTDAHDEIRQVSPVPQARSSAPIDITSVFEMSDWKRSSWKSKGIDPKLLYEGT